ncbi:uncharacterized protein LOC126803262 isoform X1 [Argentina anserina]|uniref:uncharacterized protein LOC126803262 isoform X1 n=1 Tax=Argentina anserina TaxID=57926 RepID=UPI002176895F|nr:uncharacterized protein LOC126803262 isoform X1 [Potentilla anserina]
MKRKQVSIGYAILLLIASLPSHSTAPLAIDVESAELDLQVAPTGKSMMATKHILATWEARCLKECSQGPIRAKPHGKSALTTIDPAMNERPPGGHYAKEAGVEMVPKLFWDYIRRMSS